MSNVPSNILRPFWRKPVRKYFEADAVASAADVPLGLREEQAFALPARLFEQLPFAVYVCDRDGHVLRYNRRAAELWGRSPKLGDPDERFCGSYRMFRPDGSLLPHHECPMADVLRTGVSVREQEVHIERPDGSRGIALVNIEAIKDSEGNIVGAGAECIFGYAAEEIIGKPIMILIPADYQKEEEAIIERLRRGQRVESFETVRRRKDGSLIDVSLTISPVKNARGKTIGASKIARDITERKTERGANRQSRARGRAPYKEHLGHRASRGASFSFQFIRRSQATDRRAHQCAGKGA
jgi:PAS domain S-box-containing protein